MMFLRLGNRRVPSLCAQGCWGLSPNKLCYRPPGYVCTLHDGYQYHRWWFTRHSTASGATLRNIIKGYKCTTNCSISYIIYALYRLISNFRADGYYRVKQTPGNLQPKPTYFRRRRGELTALVEGCEDFKAAQLVRCIFVGLLVFIFQQLVLKKSTNSLQVCAWCALGVPCSSLGFSNENESSVTRGEWGNMHLVEIRIIAQEGRYVAGRRWGGGPDISCILAQGHKHKGKKQLNGKILLKKYQIVPIVPIGITTRIAPPPPATFSIFTYHLRAATGKENLPLHPVWADLFGWGCASISRVVQSTEPLFAKAGKRTKCPIEECFALLNCYAPPLQLQTYVAYKAFRPDLVQFGFSSGKTCLAHVSKAPGRFVPGYEKRLLVTALKIFVCSIEAIRLLKYRRNT